MNDNQAAVLYVHGKGGNAEESVHYKPLFPGCDIIGFDYKAETPWNARPEFVNKINELKSGYDEIILVAVSIGAYFAMNAGISKDIDRAYFISPIASMERLIADMMTWAKVSEERLKQEGIIKTGFGDDLNWEYLQYVRSNPISWDVPTEIIYGSGDRLQSIETITAFAKTHGAGLAVLDGGEHWFHTDEQMKFLDEHITKCEKTFYEKRFAEYAECDKDR